MNHNYWKKYYKNNKRKDPSSFYHFIKDRVTEDDVVVDVGAGDGRDTYPLSARCKQIYTLEPNNKLPWGNFNSINDIGMSNVKPDIIYARWVFHAVSEEEEDEILQFIPWDNSKLFAEFRIEEKEGDHERRPIVPARFIDKLVLLGYTSIELYIGYFSPVEGDNPLLARVIAQYD